MKRILDPRHQRALTPFLAADTLLAFDYDGTLAPIVADRGSAHLRPGTKSLLAAVARRYATIVITGRSRNDVSRFCAGIPLLEIIGNHGAEEVRPPAHSIAHRVADWREDLLERLESLAGVSIEDKHYSLAIHYRGCNDPHYAEQRIRVAAGALEQARLIGGKAVLNVVPTDAPDKGEALLRACDRHGCRRALYVGDDETDEDVFSLRVPERVLGIRVGLESRSAADYYLADQEEIDQLLERLIEMPAGLLAT